MVLEESKAISPLLQAMWNCANDNDIVRSDFSILQFQ